MDEVTVKITGLDGLEEAFTVGAERAARRFVRAAEMDAAKVLQKTASENAPFAEGNLADNIRRESERTDNSVKVRVGPGRDAFYGLFQELGAPEAHVPALHWLEDSFHECKDEMLDVLVAGLQAGIEEMKK